MAHTELDLRERRLIEDLLAAKVPVSKIAAEIGRHRSTIYREIKRNSYVDEELPYLNDYYGVTAQRYASARRARRRKLIRLPKLRAAVMDRLKEGWSPEQIAGRLGLEGHAVRISHETIYAHVYSREGQSAALARYLPSRQFPQPRLRRECYGELIQIDGSDHHWFEDRGPSCTLLVFIDDATSTLMHLEFVTSESTFTYFGALEQYLVAHGRPVAFYSDKHTVFRVASQGAKTGHGMTQFGRALNELNIEILCANSSQAKGRVERANRTLQDRLVKELRLAGISDIDAANAFLPAFIDRCNAKFAKTPRRPDNLHRALNVEPDRLRDLLCLRDEHYVGQQLAFSYDRRRIILAENEITRGLPGKYVDSYAYPDGRLEFRWKGVVLPYSVFDKDQRVTHAAITENKHLSAVLEHIKAEQDKAPPKKRRAGKQRTRYEPTGRGNIGWNSLADRKRIAESKASQGCDI